MCYNGDDFTRLICKKTRHSRRWTPTIYLWILPILQTVLLLLKVEKVYKKKQKKEIRKSAQILTIIGWIKKTKKLIVVFDKMEHSIRHFYNQYQYLLVLHSMLLQISSYILVFQQTIDSPYEQGTNQKIYKI